MSRIVVVSITVLICLNSVSADDKSVVFLTRSASAAKDDVENAIFKVLSQELLDFGVTLHASSTEGYPPSERAAAVIERRDPVAVVWYDDDESTINIVYSSGTSTPKAVVRRLRKDSRPVSIAETVTIIVREQIGALMIAERRRSHRSKFVEAPKETAEERRAAPSRTTENDAQSIAAPSPKHNTEKRVAARAPVPEDSADKTVAAPSHEHDAEKTVTARPSKKKKENKAPPRKEETSEPPSVETSAHLDHLPVKKERDRKRFRAWTGYTLSILAREMPPESGVTAGIGGVPVRPLVLFAAYHFLAPVRFDREAVVDFDGKRFTGEIRTRIVGHRIYLGLGLEHTFGRIEFSGAVGGALTYNSFLPKSDSDDFRTREASSWQVSIPLILRMVVRLTEVLRVYFMGEAHIAVNRPELAVGIKDNEQIYFTSLRGQPTFSVGFSVALF